MTPMYPMTAKAFEAIEIPQEILDLPGHPEALSQGARMYSKWSTKLLTDSLGNITPTKEKMTLDLRCRLYLCTHRGFGVDASTTLGNVDFVPRREAIGAIAKLIKEWETQLDLLDLYISDPKKVPKGSPTRANLKAHLKEQFAPDSDGFMPYGDQEELTLKEPTANDRLIEDLKFVVGYDASYILKNECFKWIKTVAPLRDRYLAVQARIKAL
jgi:hypothetical protein